MLCGGACRYWTVALDGAQVRGQNVALGATTAIMDSGTTAILVGPDDAAAIHAVGAQHPRPPPAHVPPTCSPSPPPVTRTASTAGTHPCAVWYAAHVRCAVDWGSCACMPQQCHAWRNRGSASTSGDALVQGIQGVSYNRVGGYYSITGGCASLSSLPDIAFRIDGHAYYMPPVQWTQAVRPRTSFGNPSPCSHNCCNTMGVLHIVLGRRLTGCWRCAGADPEL